MLVVKHINVLAICLGLWACKRPLTKAVTVPPPAASRFGYVDLAPLAELRIENAYFKEGAPRKLQDYVGTQVARFQQAPRRGLRLLSIESALAVIPKDQPRTVDLVTPTMKRFRNYRYYYAVVFANRGRGTTGSAVLLGANSLSEIERLGNRLVSNPETVCDAASANCIVFPQNCTVSLEMAVTVNGVSKSMAWGSRLSAVVPAGKNVRLMRGKDVAKDFHAGAMEIRAFVLLPGDRVE